jgi:hypothetical protein
MNDIIKTFNDWQRRDIKRLKAKRKKQERERLALLSLLSIIGMVFIYLSYYYKPLIIFGVIFSIIGGINFGKLIHTTVTK